MSKIKGKFPRTLQSHIIIKAIGEKNFLEFYEQYQENSLRIRVVQPPTASQVRLANLAKEIGYTPAAHKVGVAVQQVYWAVSRVAKYNFLKGGSEE